METRPKYFYPSLVIAAVAVTLFSLVGIASMTGTLPAAHSSEKSTNAAAADKSADNGLPTAAVPPGRPEAAKAVCAICGTVQNIHAVEHRSSGSGLGAVAGGLAGALLGNQFGSGNGRTAMTIAGGAGGAYLGNRVEQNSHRSIVYQVKLRMDDGTLRSFQQKDAPFFAAGDRVKVVNDTIVPMS